MTADRGEAVQPTPEVSRFTGGEMGAEPKTPRSRRELDLTALQCREGRQQEEVREEVLVELVQSSSEVRCLLRGQGPQQVCGLTEATNAKEMESRLHPGLVTRTVSNHGLDPGKEDLVLADGLVEHAPREARCRDGRVLPCTGSDIVRSAEE